MNVARMIKQCIAYTRIRINENQLSQLGVELLFVQKMETLIYQFTGVSLYLLVHCWNPYLMYQYMKPLHNLLIGRTLIYSFIIQNYHPIFHCVEHIFNISGSRKMQQNVYLIAVGRILIKYLLRENPYLICQWLEPLFNLSGQNPYLILVCKTLILYFEL